MKLRRTNEDTSDILDNSATLGPHQKDFQVEHIDTDIESDGNHDVDELYKTPVALQKKKTMPAPVIKLSESEDSDSEVEHQQKKKDLNVSEKKENKGHRTRPVPDRALQVSLTAAV